MLAHNVTSWYVFPTAFALSLSQTDTKIHTLALSFSLPRARAVVWCWLAMRCPGLSSLPRKEREAVYGEVAQWFGSGSRFDVLVCLSDRSPSHVERSFIAEVQNVVGGGAVVWCWLAM